MSTESCLWLKYHSCLFLFFTTGWHHWFILILGLPVNILNVDPVFQSSGRLSTPCYLHLMTCAVPPPSHQWWVFRAMASRGLFVCAALFDTPLHSGSMQVNLQASFCLSHGVFTQTKLPLLAYEDIRAAFSALSQSLLFCYRKKLDWFDIICFEQIQAGCS